MQEPSTAQTGNPRMPFNSKQQAAVKAMQEQIEQGRKVISRLAATEDGMMLFRYLYKITGMGQSPVIVDKSSSEISEKLTLTLLGRQEVWYDLKQIMPNEVLAEILCPKDQGGVK